MLTSLLAHALPSPPPLLMLPRRHVTRVAATVTVHCSSLYNMTVTLGSVTLKRVVLFCFSTKSSTHTTVTA